jgi:hypothetical protein
MSEGTKKHLAAVAEVVHSYFQQLFKENKKYIRVDATLHTEGIYKERAMDVSVTIKAGNKYSQAEVMGNWVSANTTSNSVASKERKQLHPDTVYGVLAHLMSKKYIPAGSLGYYQIRSKANSTTFGQPLASASHNPTYVLPNGPHVKHWLWTTYKDSKWYNNIFTGDSNMQTYIDGIEEIDYSDINSEWYKSAYKKNVKDINTWMSAEIMPNHVVQKYQQIQRAAVNWKKIPTVAEAYVGEMFDMPDYQVTPYDQNLGDLVEQGAV